MTLLLLFAGQGTPGQTPPPPVETVSVGSSISGSSFSRKRWEEFKAAWQAQYAAETKATEIKSEPKRKVAVKAAQIAARALELAQAEDEMSIRRLHMALQAAAGARTVAETIARAKDAQRIATAMIEEIEEDDIILMMLTGL